MRLHKDKAGALCVSYFWLCSYLSTQLVCMAGRVQLIIFLSINKVLSNFIPSMQKWRKIFIISTWSYKNKQSDWQKVLEELWNIWRQRTKAIVESECSGNDLGTLEGCSPFDSSFQCSSRNVETLLNRLLFICKNILLKWQWQYWHGIALLCGIVCNSFWIRKVKCHPFSVPPCPNRYGAIQLIFTVQHAEDRIPVR